MGWARKRYKSGTVQQSSFERVGFSHVPVLHAGVRFGPQDNWSMVMTCKLKLQFLMRSKGALFALHRWSLHVVIAPFLNRTDTTGAGYTQFHIMGSWWFRSNFELSGLQGA